MIRFIECNQHAKYNFTLIIKKNTNTLANYPHTKGKHPNQNDIFTLTFRLAFNRCQQDNFKFIDSILKKSAVDTQKQKQAARKCDAKN